MFSPFDITPHIALAAGAMIGTALISYLTIFNAFGYAISDQEIGKFGCQERSTSGRTYVGVANTTVHGIPCQRWSDTNPHDQSFTHVGDHNFCRNPIGASQSQVWCYTNDPELEKQNCSVPFCPPLKALDFSLDNDGRTDEKTRYTHASLRKENLPLSFTICTAFMVKSWTSYQNARLFVLRDDNGHVWLWVEIAAMTTYTEFSFQFEDSPRILTRSELLFYPLQWTRVCLSRDSNTSLARMIVDGELLVEHQVEVKIKLGPFDLVLGLLKKTYEQPGQTTNLNIFSSALTVDQMKSQTRPGEVGCGLEGDFLSWSKSVEEEQWTLHSKARWVDLDGGLEGPCMEKGKISVFLMNEGHWHSECMKHCGKFGGQSPSVKAENEWENLWKQVKAVSPDSSRLPELIWLSATEGDTGLELGDLDHWPEGVEAEEGVWRDYYTGEQLENFARPWENSNKDKDLVDTYNCIVFNPTLAKPRTWVEWQCGGQPRGCPCAFDSPPLVQLRGFCPDTLLEQQRYAVTQSATDPNNIIMVGFQSARIQYDFSLGHWVYSDPRLNVTAKSRASQKSFVLGKHNWTISGDSYQCSKDKDYEIELKLTGCKVDEFTCNDGQCIKMEERCDQLPQCEDKSDEQKCKILDLDFDYNKKVPPLIAKEKTKEKQLLQVKVSMTLQKVVAIEEDDYSISFKFMINLIWRENRVTYKNLKNNSANLLSQEEINMLWLPRVIYWNTDQEETTRLGVEWEWTTDILVEREGKMARRSSLEDIDEAEIFKGSENSLRMEQTYTHAFQCVFELSKYPFDTQVTLYFVNICNSYFVYFCLLSFASFLTFPINLWP